jgi:hypothetical protein
MGPRNVIGVCMPSRFTATQSVVDAQRIAQNLAIRRWTSRSSRHTPRSWTCSGPPSREDARLNGGEPAGPYTRHDTYVVFQQVRVACAVPPATRARWPRATRPCMEIWPAASPCLRTSRRRWSMSWRIITAIPLEARRSFLTPSSSGAPFGGTASQPEGQRQPASLTRTWIPSSSCTSRTTGASHR